jgi:DNA-binding transcriptional MocR family regulator
VDERDVAETLKELERKLSELEGTLRSLTGVSDSQPAPQPAKPPVPPPRATEPSPPPPSTSRIVDETIEGHFTLPTTPAAPTQPGVRRAPVVGRRAPWEEPAAEAARPAPPSAPAPPAAPPVAPAAQAPAPAPADMLRFREQLERTTRGLTHDYDELLGRLSYGAMAATTTTSTISFARGVPSLDIIDVDGLRDAAVRAFESDPEGTTAYGTSVGYPRLRSWIAARHGVEPERVLVTNGSLQADAFLFDQLVHSGDEVVVESPTYDRTLLSLQDRGARVHAVELGQEGIEVEQLAALLSGGARPTMAHVIPNFQNPAGYTLSLERRQRLVELAHQYGFMILEDDPYVDLRFSGEPVASMLSLDGERVVYASSFTKTVCPGVRVGYLVGPAELIGKIAKAATNMYISPGMVSEAIVYEFCASGGLERSIETVKTALSERARTLSEALERDLPEARFVAPQGGYFLWVTLPEGTNVHALLDAAAERGVAFVKGTDFLLDGGLNTLRLAYSGVTPEQIETGVARLADAYRSL